MNASAAGKALAVTSNAVKRNLKHEERTQERVAALIADPPAWLVTERIRAVQLADGSVLAGPAQKYPRRRTKDPAKKKWSEAFVSQTSLGMEYGLSPIAFGRVLGSVGLKTGSMPSDMALAAGIAKTTLMRTGVTAYRWHREQVIAALTAAGHHRIDDEAIQRARDAAKAKVAVRDITAMPDEDRFARRRIEASRIGAA